MLLPPSPSPLLLLPIADAMSADGCDHAAGAAVPRLPDDDDQAIDVIVQYLKSEGVFDSLRKECLDDMDQKVPHTGPLVESPLFTHSLLTFCSVCRPRS